jgi:Sodium/hydrogen exchanger family
VSADSILTHVVGAVAVIVATAHLFGLAAHRLGQPQIVGQILAGIALSPGVLGQVPGHLSTRLFPAVVVPYINIAAQVALVLFLFAVGYELDFRPLRNQRQAVPAVAVCAFATPMVLGGGSVEALGSMYDPHDGSPLTMPPSCSSSPSSRWARPDRYRHPGQNGRRLPRLPPRRTDRARVDHRRRIAQHPWIDGTDRARRRTPGWNHRPPALHDARGDGVADHRTDRPVAHGPAVPLARGGRPCPCTKPAAGQQAHGEGASFLPFTQRRGHVLATSPERMES